MRRNWANAGCHYSVRFRVQITWVQRQRQSSNRNGEVPKLSIAPGLGGWSVCPMARCRPTSPSPLLHLTPSNLQTFGPSDLRSSSPWSLPLWPAGLSNYMAKLCVATTATNASDRWLNWLKWRWEVFATSFRSIIWLTITYQLWRQAPLMRERGWWRSGEWEREWLKTKIDS